MPSLPRCIRGGLVVLATAVAVHSAPAQETAPSGISTARERSAHPEAESAAREIRCDCGCPPQSVWDCACGHAAGMVEAMDREALAGASSEDIIAGYLDREGPAILLEPPARGWNLTAWVGPSAAILVGAVAILVLLRGWRRRGAATDAPEAADDGSDDEYRRRAAEELERFDRGDLA